MFIIPLPKDNLLYGFADKLTDEQREIPELFVLVTVDDEGNVVGYPKHGGNYKSGTRPRVKAYDCRSSAKRGRGQMMNVEIAKITGLELVD